MDKTMKILVLFMALLIATPAYGSWVEKVKIQGYNGTEWTNISNDRSTNSLVTISSNHKQLHDGDVYYVAGWSALGDGDDVVFITTTPNTDTRVYMEFDIATSGALEFSVYETATVDNDGTAATPFNHDRNSTKTSSLQVSMDSTIVAEGTKIYSEYIGVTGAPTTRKGSTLGSNNELILKAGTKYLWKMSSDSAANNVSYVGYWREYVPIN